MIYKPARIRFDDVLVKSTNPKLKDKELQKFLKQVRWCKNTGVPLSLAILCENTETIPGAIESIKELADNGIVSLDLHGWDHSDYGSKSQEEITKHFDKALEWFQKNFQRKPVRFITPHGAYSENIQIVSDQYNLIVETTKPPVADIRMLEPMLRQTRDLKVFQDQIVMVHFWELGLRLWRLTRIIEHQNIEKAIKVTKEELSEKEHRIIWKNWERSEGE